MLQIIQIAFGSPREGLLGLQHLGNPLESLGNELLQKILDENHQIHVVGSLLQGRDDLVRERVEEVLNGLVQFLADNNESLHQSLHFFVGISGSVKPENLHVPQNKLLEFVNRMFSKLLELVFLFDEINVLRGEGFRTQLLLGEILHLGFEDHLHELD